MIDLHTHSKYSDGSNSVEEIIALAKQLDLQQLAITDHNILDGSKLAHQIWPEKTIIGVELSVGYSNKEVHLLGYFPNDSDYKNTQFVINNGEINKKIALAEMVENLNNEGYNISLTELSQYGQGVINRVHICRALMAHGYIESVQEGFSKLIGDNCPAYVEREYVPIQEACQAIHDDGGIAVIAHPYNYKAIKDIPKLLADINKYIDGIECYHPSANTQQSTFLIDYALKNNKRITGGSDYHGENKPTIKLSMMNVDDIYAIR